MSITDELREWMDRTTIRFDGRGCLLGTAEELTAIADRIDAEHESACAEAYGNGVQSVALPDMTAYVKLPVDADGVPIHIGDVLDPPADCDDYPPMQVMRLMYDGYELEWFFDGDVGGFCGMVGEHMDVAGWTHHHAPTVEDVLREMHAELDEVTALYVGEAIDSDERNRDEARIFAEYAKRLTLAGDAE